MANKRAESRKEKKLCGSYPCLNCGHPKNQHIEAWAWVDGMDSCMIGPKEPLFHYCTYKADNLSYLEQEYERHNR